MAKKKAAAHVAEKPAGRVNPIPTYPSRKGDVFTHTPDFLCRMCGHRHRAAVWQHQLDTAEGRCAACGSNVVTVEGDPKYQWPVDEPIAEESDGHPVDAA